MKHLRTAGLARVEGLRWTVGAARDDRHTYRGAIPSSRYSSSLR